MRDYDFSVIKGMLEHELESIEDRKRLDYNLIQSTNCILDALCKVYKICKIRDDIDDVVLGKVVEDEVMPEETHSELDHYEDMMNNAKTEQERQLLQQLMNVRRNM